MHEWPLILFTTLMQISIGCFLFTMLFAVINKNRTKINVLIMSSFAFGILGLITSVFHLGNPWHMYNTMNNVLSSWMSREVLFVGSYVGLLTLNILYFLLKKKNNTLLLTATAILGISTIFVMSNIYINSLFTLWNGWVTYSSFWATTFIAGGIVACLIFSIVLKKENQIITMQKAITLYFILMFVGVILNIVGCLYLQNNMADNATLGISAIYVDAELITTLTLIKFVLIIISLLMIILFKRQLNQSIKISTIAATSIIIVIAEIIGRYSFFSLGV